MLNLPKSTEMNKQLPKKAIYAKFNMNTAARDRFDADISRITIVNEISPSTVTTTVGENVKSIYVLLVSLKHKNYNDKLIEQLTKLIDKNMLFVLEYGNEARLAVYHSKVISSDWQKKDDLSVLLKGLDLDSVWENIIVQVGDIHIDHNNSLDEQLALDERRMKLQREIDRLEKLARAERQPKKKFELVQKLRQIDLELIQLSEDKHNG